MFKLLRKKIGIIGYGNMGSAMVKRLKSKYQIYVFDKDENKTNNLAKIKVADSIVDLVKTVDTVILAVKPQDIAEVLNEIKDHAKDKLIISIAAGKPCEYIEKCLGRVKIIRAMPNIGVKIGKSETCLCSGRFTDAGDLNFAQKLFDYVGKTWKIEERMMDSATAISGSGPAYIYYDIELNKIDPYNIPEEKKQDYIKRLTKAAEKLGFKPTDAIDLATSTTATSLSLISVTKMPPSELKRQITSKGGTTEAALEILQKNGTWEEAAQAAKRRAEELSKQE